MSEPVPVTISYRNIEPSESIEDAVRSHATRLEKFCSSLISTRVLLETPHRRGQKGQHHHVRIEMAVPGNDLIVSHDPGDVEAHEDLSVATRDAFRAARRELEDYSQKRRHQVKRH